MATYVVEIPDDSFPEGSVGARLIVGEVEANSVKAAATLAVEEGIVEADMPMVLHHVRGSYPATVRASTVYEVDTSDPNDEQRAE